MAATTKAELAARVRRLRKSLEREKAKNAALGKSLAEALEQQAATGEILRVISRSPADVQPVFDAIVRRALRLIGGHSAAVTRIADGMLHLAALTSTSKSGDAALKKGYPRALAQAPFHGRAIRSREPYCIRDTEKVPHALARARDMGRARGYRSAVVVPLLRDGTVIGTLSVTRREPGPFVEHQIDLLKTFAEQAVIAIENVRLFNETKEALEHQKASADILRVISGSPTDLAPVMMALAESAARLCEATDAHVWQREGDDLQLVASHGPLPIKRPRLRIGRDSVTGRAVFESKLVHVHDLAAVFEEEFPNSRAMMEGGYRSVLAVPLLREGSSIGAILIRRTEVRPFTPKQLALLQTFADQAVIAIENVRLFNETKEALDRQTATSEVLKTISRSTFDLNAVLQVLIENATRLAGASQGFIFRYDGEFARMAFSYNAKPAYAAMIEANPIAPGRGSLVGRTLIERRPVHIPDALADREFTLHEAQRLGGFRSMLGIPMMREGNLIGVIAIWTTEVRPFTEKQIELVSGFADQAVIAIENVRLFNETKEALEQQTATADILKVISSSPTDLAPVFDAILDCAMRLCEAHLGLLNLYDGERLRTVGQRGGNPAFVKWLFERGAFEPPPEMARMIAELKPFQVRDVKEIRSYIDGVVHPVKFVELGGARSYMAVPLIKDGKVTGNISIFRPEVRPFTDKQIELVKTFADQAVIAIENVRLFNETREALEHQKASADILRVISGSPTDLAPVMTALAESAARLCEATDAHVWQREGDDLQLVASHGPFPIRRPRHRIGRESVSGRAVFESKLVHVHDLAAVFEEEFPNSWPMMEGGYRTVLAVPLVREGSSIGAILIRRTEVRPFTPKQLALLQTFADQAVIAIENVRLFNETKEALERQTATSEILKVIASSPSDIEPVFDAIAESAKRLLGGLNAVVTRVAGDRQYLVAYTKSGLPGDDAITKLFPAAVGDWNSGRAIMTRVPAIRVDTEADPDISAAALENARARGYRSLIAVPMLREDKAIGSISVTRREPGPFRGEQIGLLKTFADQAVIAIENVRLFNETKEALERQTATAAVLRAISSSPDDIAPVFAEILEHATRLCEAEFGFVFTSDGRAFNPVAQRGLDAERFAAWSAAFRSHRTPGPLSGLGKILSAKAPVHIADIADDEAYRARDPLRVLTVEAIGARTFLAVPLIKESAVIGAVVTYRREVRPFGEKQVALLQTFADQAVIAIENVRLFNETKEALERQTATSNVLREISRSTFDLNAVLQTLLDSAMRLCGASTSAMFLQGADGLYRFAAQSGYEPGSPLEKILLDNPVRPGTDTTTGRALLERRTVHAHDVQSVPGYRADLVALAEYRTNLAVPMLRDGAVVGAITLTRGKEINPFTDKQIELVEGFAAQAVIAIENVRLFNETKEALERQTATAEILKVIASSPSDVQPVFDAIVTSAARVFGRRAALRIVEPGGTRRRARSEAASADSPDLLPIDDDSLAGRVILHATAMQVVDTLGPDAPPYAQANAHKWDFRAYAAAPLIRDGKAIGSISVASPVPGALSDKQMALLATFADQAVIAIENVRLFNETKEALERQTATAEILKVISSSPTDVQPVFNAIVQSAIGLVDPWNAAITMREGDKIYLRAAASPRIQTVNLDRFMGIFPISFDPTEGELARAIAECRVVELMEVKGPRATEIGKRIARAGKYRSGIVVPLVRENEGIGAIVLTHPEPGLRPTEKQLALIQTFASQAVIAIENVRLFNETKEALERQTATAEILKVISGSPTDVQPVFDAIVESAARLFGRTARIRILEGNELHLRASFGPAGSAVPAAPLPITHDSIAGAIVLEKTTIQIADTQAPGVPAGNVGRGYRAIAAAPLLREGNVLGAVAVTCLEPGALSDKQMALLRTFADQAVIAIENVRLFKELEARTSALAKSVGQLTALGEVGQAISSTLDLETVLKTIVSRAVQLTGLDAGSIYEYDERAEEFQVRATENVDEEYLAVLRRTPIRKGEGAVGRAALTGEPTQIPDVLAASYQTRLREALIRAGYRAVLVVPLRREEHVIGALSVTRKTSGPFAAEIVELLKTFATQSALAIQNARLFREIAEKGKQLEVASQHKSQFLASMSHELRTPLNALLGFNEMILGDVYGAVPADMQPPLAQMQTSGKHLLRLINNVLDLAKIEAGRMELALSDYSVYDTVESVRSTLQPLAADKGLDFLATVPEDIPLAYGDPGRITQCLMNLAGNSLKFTKTGKVEISVAEKGGVLTYCVADTGIGIPPDKIGSLFTEFKQTDATIASEYGGTGLGLSISKKFVEMHGGRIWVESEPGQGSTFIFEIPLRAGEGKAA